MTLTKLDNCINSYIYTITFEQEINKELKRKKIRYSNFPSHISENIIKYVENAPVPANKSIKFIIIFNIIVNFLLFF